MFNKIGDFLWVLQAFLRGKLFCQKAYRPQGNFFPPVPVTIKRVSMLMKWWGHRLMSIDEVVRLMEQEQMAKQDDDSGRVPSFLNSLNWTGSDWEKKDNWGNWGNWDNSHRFIAVRD